MCVSVWFEGQKDGECDAKKAPAPHVEQVAQVVVLALVNGSTSSVLRTPKSGQVQSSHCTDPRQSPC